MSIKLQFVSLNNLISPIIEWFSSGDYSHVDAVLPDETLLGSRSTKAGALKSGVQIRPKNYQKFKRVMIIEIDCTDYQANIFYQFLKDQIGKPYDKEAIFAFIFNRNWNDKSKWFCSELIMAALEEAGITSKIYIDVNKITPVALSLIANTIGGKVMKE